VGGVDGIGMESLEKVEKEGTAPTTSVLFQVAMTSFHYDLPGLVMGKYAKYISILLLHLDDLFKWNFQQLRCATCFGYSLLKQNIKYAREKKQEIMRQTKTLLKHNVDIILRAGSC